MSLLLSAGLVIPLMHPLAHAAQEHAPPVVVKFDPSAPHFSADSDCETCDVVSTLRSAPVVESATRAPIPVVHVLHVFDLEVVPSNRLTLADARAPPASLLFMA